MAPLRKVSVRYARWDLGRVDVVDLMFRTSRPQYLGI
jgi:hypothetical protein